jgi:pyruvate,water dikinase
MDEAHQSAPLSNCMVELIKLHMNPGTEEGSQRYGLLIERFDIRSLDGWLFMRPRIVGAPEKPGPLPPRWLFSLLFRFHPALRRRSKAAAEAVAGLRWRQDAEWWLNEGREPMLTRLRALQSVELAVLDDEGLREHLASCHAVLADGCRIHFRNSLAHWIGVGDWLAVAKDWAGTTPEEALHALEGASRSSVDALPYLDRIAAAAKESPAALNALTRSGEAHERLQALRDSSLAVATALDEYVAEHGWRIFTGFDIAHKATIEVPESVIDSVAARLDPRDEEPRGRVIAETLRAKVPAAHLDEFDALFETAQLLYGVRDNDAGPCIHWTMGLVRRALLEAGERLSRRNRLNVREHIFEATRSEVDALLSASGVAVFGDDLASRAAARAIAAGDKPPARLGEDEGPPPPDDWLPPAVARVNGALMLAMSVEYPSAVADAGPTSALTLKGLAASRGQYEGRACVVQGPDDFARLRPGDVLVAPFTTTAYAVVLPQLGGVVTDKGGVLSHAAIVAREYGIPAVVNTGNATSVIADGARIKIDGLAGTVEVIAAPAPATEGQPVGASQAASIS